MNGIHDMGGLHGFGTVEVEPDEPVFHEEWEARVFGIVQSLPGNIDAGRHSLECLDPVAYLKDGYYGRWLAALEQGMRALGVLSEAAIDERVRRGPQRRRRVKHRQGTGWRPLPTPYVRAVEREPAFCVGQAVRTRNHQPAGHTRLPAYGRSHRGEIVRVHPAMVFPDDHAHDRGENPQHLYTVRFEGSELWGDGAEPGTFVHLDLFEAYLEKG